MNNFDFLNFITHQSFILLAFDSQNFGSVIIGISAVFILLMFSGMISASEVAFFSINPKQLKDIMKSDHSVDKLIIHHLDNPRRLLATILISNNFVNISIILIAAWITPLLYDFSGSPFIGFLVQVVAITFILLLFGEIMPKIYARQKVESFVHIMARPLLALSKVFYPLVYILEHSTVFIDRQILKKKNPLSMSELSEVVEIAQAQANDVENEEVKILKGIATFGETEVREIMRARVDVSAVDIELTFSELIVFIKEWGYSRFPVFDESFDHVKGILHIKDLLPHLQKDNFNWQSLLRDPFFIPENKKINDLLQDFKTKKIHMAVVVDEYGGTSGIVTLEDVLEEILGEISDEFDSKESENLFFKISDKVWTTDAKTSINDLCKFMGLDLDFFDEVKGESDSVGGLLLELTGDFPQTGQKIKYKIFEFEVIIKDNKRIKKVKVSINE